MRACQMAKAALRFTYPLEESLMDKINSVARNIYKAKDVEYSVRNAVR